MKIIKGRFIFILLFLYIQNSFVLAKNFTSQYCEFTLPPGWECQLEGSEYICQSDNADRKKEAIIILAAKIAGAKDTLDEYMSYLKTTKTFRLPGGKTQVSEPKEATKQIIQGQSWINAMHLASEVPGFYTRYLATVKADLGIVVTFTVEKNSYSAYNNVFEDIIKSLKVFRQRAIKASDVVRKENDLPPAIDDTSRIQIETTGAKKQERSLYSSDSQGMFLIIILIAVLIFIILKFKKKK